MEAWADNASPATAAPMIPALILMATSSVPVGIRLPPTGTLLLLSNPDKRDGGAILGVVRGPRSENRGQEAGDRGQGAGDRGPRSEVRGPQDRGWETGNRGQGTGDGRQETGYRGRTESPRSEVGGPRSAGQGMGDREQGTGNRRRETGDRIQRADRKSEVRRTLNLEPVTRNPLQYPMPNLQVVRSEDPQRSCLPAGALAKAGAMGESGPSRAEAGKPLSCPS